ncbi:Ppx/GppA phosphatase family protein [Bacillus testis]|uniref:Ppx/GppA phosphatase family protein n=1 Tax=Bacillus testis TaxID=1622072 RepID=UPI00067EF9A0|nr:phosphatase [Bacillus testis]
MICGVIDVGSNTIRLNIYQYEEGKLISLLHKKTMAGLAAYVDKGCMNPKGIDTACRILLEYKNIVKHFNIRQMNVFATASLRNIVNTDEVVRVIKERTGYRVEVISGEEEAVLDFIGATHDREIEHGLMVDIGGGSTELAFIEDSKIVQAISLPIGSLSLFSLYAEKLFPKKSERQAMKHRVKQELDKISAEGDFTKYPAICGVGGTIRAAKKLDDAQDGNHSAFIRAESVDHLLELLKKGKKDTLRRILQVVPDRVHTIVPGLIILQAIARRFGCERIYVSQFGVREGYVYNRVLKEGSQHGET